MLSRVFFFNAPPPTHIYTLSLHDALPISIPPSPKQLPMKSAASTKASSSSPRKTSSAKQSSRPPARRTASLTKFRSEEHTSELQSRFDLVCRLLLEKKK